MHASIESNKSKQITIAMIMFLFVTDYMYVLEHFDYFVCIIFYKLMCYYYTWIIIFLTN